MHHLKVCFVNFNNNVDDDDDDDDAHDDDDGDDDCKIKFLTVEIFLISKGISFHSLKKMKTT